MAWNSLKSEHWQREGGFNSHEMEHWQREVGVKFPQNGALTEGGWKQNQWWDLEKIMYLSTKCYLWTEVRRGVSNHKAQTCMREVPIKYFCTEHIDLISVHVCTEMFAIVYCSSKISILRSHSWISVTQRAKVLLLWSIAPRKSSLLFAKCMTSTSANLSLLND